MAGPVLAGPVLAGSGPAADVCASGSAVVTECLRLAEGGSRPPGDAAFVQHPRVDVEHREHRPAAFTLDVEDGTARLAAQAHLGPRESLANAQHGLTVGLDLVATAELVPDHLCCLLSGDRPPPHLAALH